MPTAITHFKFRILPDPNAVDSQINGVPLVVLTLYPIADQNLLTFERTTKFDNLSLKVPFLYSVVDNVNNYGSNDALIRLEWKGVAANPASSDVSQVINNSQVINLLDILPLNDVTEWIEIISMTNGFWLSVNGIKSKIGIRLTILDLYYTTFTALAEGGGDPYFELGYKVGEDNTSEPTLYTLDLDIVSLAEISIGTPADILSYNDDFDVTGQGLFVEYAVKEETTIIKIDKGYAYGTAAVQIVIASDFLLLNQWNKVILQGNEDQEYFSNQTINIVLELDKLGIGEIQITNFIVYENQVPALGQITLTLNDINGNPALVNGTQVQQILTNL